MLPSPPSPRSTPPQDLDPLPRYAASGTLPKDKKLAEGSIKVKRSHMKVGSAEDKENKESLFSPTGNLKALRKLRNSKIIKLL
ncbi:hypothetical protein E2C01_020493 [Portunus trituberculatus]|uniref:Uncharacterized protein n=1 Tax=Portunus trituberculatus TaxID=210409 RepID=A0A5B7E1M5_PORTR|nr:hypothetical protein [Portunus trituberculatus]